MYLTTAAVDEQRTTRCQAPFEQCIERNTNVMDKSRHHSFAGSLLCLGEESVNMRVHGREGDDNLGRIVVMGVAEM